MPQCVRLLLLRGAKEDAQLLHAPAAVCSWSRCRYLLFSLPDALLFGLRASCPDGSL